MDEDKFNQDVAFNLSSLMMGELHRLLVKANNHYLKCDWKWCFHTLVCLKNSVIQSFSKEERELLTMETSSEVSRGFNGHFGKSGTAC